VTGIDHQEFIFMKKALAFIIVLALLAGLLAGCGASTAPTPDGGARLRIVATIFPAYDWVRQIVGNTQDVELTMLLDDGVDLHSYQPTVDDIVKISECDMFLYVGGESDKWVRDALREATNKSMVVINLLELLGDQVSREELVEGMEAEEEDEDEGEDEDEIEYDEHVWLSLRRAETVCAAIAQALGELDAENAPVYAANAGEYIEKLRSLDAEYAAAAEAAAFDTVLFGDRFPFRYLADDYGLRYYAAFAGCSAETEASFQTVVFLSAKVDELGLPAILQLESSDGSIARTIRDNTAGKNQQILVMDSMQSATGADIEQGATYLSVMENNLAVLMQALN